ncbi:hypothetical protein [Actinosynnema pretiosum]|uniref:Uncharacterized protein n=1 Tax=Actinosynnema pretiosum TaxID=42197 RepID=A0A290ZAF4_9PSEU|nr:hypothetical protein [Actinosynnema pretiosum]ATE55976.1 hypothetical protein CNX65_24090 [Actinosynnema pretiosum]
MEIWYSKRTGEVLVLATAAAFQGLSDVVRGGGEYFAAVPEGTGSYRGFLRRCAVEVRPEGMVSVEVDPDTGDLLVTGGVGHLGDLADELQSFGEEAVPGADGQMRVEHYPDHLYLTGPVPPLVLELAE